MAVRCSVHTRTLTYGMSQSTSSPSLSEEAALHAWDRTDWFCHCNIHDKSRMKHSQLMRPDRGIDARPTLILPFGMSQSPRFYWTSHPKYLYFSPRIIIVILEITNPCVKFTIPREISTSSLLWGLGYPCFPNYL